MIIIKRICLKYIEIQDIILFITRGMFYRHIATKIGTSNLDTHNND